MSDNANANERMHLQQSMQSTSESIHQRALRAESKRHISDGRQTPEERAAARVYASAERSWYCTTCKTERVPGYPSTAACFNAGHNVIW